ncbi:MAG: aromatic ring-hydroxylating dioxygenase subunit alpha, partial [Spongiibacter sp.]|nr:aromatic ring-hydroxylating dioxygenase subunit alpha [Spongiibacter sp.]
MTDPLIIDDNDRGVFKVARRSFTSQEIFEQERDRIFQNCWLYLGHESELRNANEFVTRTVAGQNLIFVRGKDGEVRAFFNVCPHRGATVCREKKGKAKSFQCMYHGWVFKNNGEINHLSGEPAYAKDFKENGNCNLRAVPHLDSYAGFYFVSFKEDIEPLPDYLAGAKEYLDIVADQSSAGMEIVGGTQEYSIRANWKLLVENSVDGYHAESTHATYLDYLMNTNGSLTATKLAGKGYDLGNGHAVIEYSAPW